MPRSRPARHSKKSLPLFAMVFIFVSLTMTPLFASSKEKVLHDFNGTDGAYPAGGLIFDGSGSLFGTTGEGGAFSGCLEHTCGTVIRLTRKADGVWAETVLHSFQNNGEDGYFPNGGLIFDVAGNLYGTTLNGGAPGAACPSGCGTVFELTPNAHGTWTETVLYSFCSTVGCGDGSYPVGLTFDGDGNLYGTTTYGGTASETCPSGCGTVFELTRGGTGDWTEKILHRFDDSKDGYLPNGGVILDRAGHLYGITAGSVDSGYCVGYYGCGTAFELIPGADGKWTAKLLHRFGTGNDGFFPLAGLVMDGTSALYGTTYGAGANGDQWYYYGSYGCGSAFQLKRGAKGKWILRTLHRFHNNGRDGYYPSFSLILDAARNLYGTTDNGGTDGPGTAFQLTRGANGTWTEKVLYSFGTWKKDGVGPSSALILDKAGRLYGETVAGGTRYCGLPGDRRYYCGTVVEITP